MRFWLDSWVSERPLNVVFPNLYALAVRPGLSVGEALSASPPLVPFVRELTQVEADSWAEVCTMVGDTHLSAGQDEVSWALASSGRFSVKSLYEKLTEGQVMAPYKDIWQVRVPLKIKVFLWQLLRNKLPTSDNIAKRHGPSSGMCAVCGSLEDANHVFFRCHLARFAWSAVREAAGVSWNPSSGADLLNLLAPLQGSSKRVIWRSVGALLWSLWTIRNKLTIEGVFPSHPADCIFKCTTLLQQWAPLGRRQDSETMEVAIARFKTIYNLSRQEFSVPPDGG